MPPRDVAVLNTAPLTASVASSDRRAYARLVEAQLPPQLRRPRATVLLFFVAVLGLSMMLFLPLSLRMLLDEPDTDDLLLGLFGVLIPAGMIAVPVWVCCRWIGEDRLRVRLRDFAEANGWIYRPWVPSGGTVGAAFEGTGDQHLLDVLRTPDQRIEFGRYRSITGSGRSRRVVSTEYVTFHVPAELPHIVLDNRANDRPFGRSNLEFDPVREQRLRLEGDFDRHFRLYCPTGYEADALYLLPPDIMQALLDHTQGLDVELMGSTVRLYAPQGIVTTDGENWRRLLGTVGAMQEMARQWAPWRDDRLDSGDRLSPGLRPLGVARQGRLLRTRFPWLAMIFGALVLVIGLASIIGDLVTWISSWTGG